MARVPKLSVQLYLAMYWLCAGLFALSEFPVFLIVDSKLVLNLDMMSYSSLFLLADQPFYCFALRQGLIL